MNRVGMSNAEMTKLALINVCDKVNVFMANIGF